MTRLSKKLVFLSLPILLGALTLLVGGMTLAAEAAIIPPSELTAKSVQGSVMTSAEDPVANALVVAYRVYQNGHISTQTANDGSYDLQLGPGLWAITAEPISITIPGEWLYSLEPQQVEFKYNDEPEQYELDFTVTIADSAVQGVVEMPGGGAPPFGVTVGLWNGEGLGRRTLVDPDTGEFEMRLPHGRYDVVVHPQHDGYIGPRVEPVHLPPGDVVDLGTLTLVPLDARISGRVVDGQGEGVVGIPVSAWRRDRDEALTTHTDEDGDYELAVTAGTWHVQPSPGPDIPYLYLGEGEAVHVGPGETVSGVDFEVLAADATIVGLLISEEALAVMDLDGWASAVNLANPDIHNGAPIRQSHFAIHVPRGDYDVSVHLPPGSPYLSSAHHLASVESGQTVTLTIPLKKKDAAIAGPVVDPRQDQLPVTGVAGAVSAWSGHNWATTHIRPDSGTYILGVAAGVWHANYHIASREYVKLGHGANIPLQSGQIAQWPLPVTRKDAAIAGKVLAPNGDPVPGAVVIADGLHGPISGLWLRTHTDEEGYFKMALPYGRYRIGATGGEPGWINPVEPIIGVPPNGIVEGIVLQFHEPNAVLSGSIAVNNTPAGGQVLVWAWSERGGFTYGHFDVALANALASNSIVGQATGRYELGVLSGATWHVGGVFETEDAYWAGRGSVQVEGETAELDLALNGPHPKPPPTVVTFDAAEAQRLTLADDTKIFIPAGAMPVEGMVTLRIVPLATLPHQRHAHIIRYGYAFFATDETGRPIEEHFNHNVLIKFKYEENDLAFHEADVRPAYFSTTTNQWTVPPRYVVDPVDNVVTMAIDHFTDFALIESPAAAELYLPLVNR